MPLGSLAVTADGELDKVEAHAVWSARMFPMRTQGRLLVGGVGIEVGGGTRPAAG